MSVMGNTIVLGAIVFLLTWVLRKLQWPVNGTRAIWLTMGVSVVIAVVETLTSDGLLGIFVCSIGSDPIGAVNCVVEILEAIVAQAAIVWAASQAVYKVLRWKLGSERV